MSEKRVKTDTAEFKESAVKLAVESDLFAHRFRDSLWYSLQATEVCEVEMAACLISRPPFLLLDDDTSQQITNTARGDNANQTGHHKAVVEVVLTNFGGASAIEIAGCDV